METIAYRFWNKNCPTFYVASIKGKKGDWGYTTKAADAISLSPFHQKRFLADCRAVGVMPTFIPV